MNFQNNVLELWSLFDFLMPGLLGTEKQFTARYCKPILAARDSRATAQHQETGALAMEALHKQVKFGKLIQFIFTIFYIHIFLGVTIFIKAYERRCFTRITS